VILNISEIVAYVRCSRGL